ncbi:Retrovirus-related Pol polyprotein from transposon TNT 1-94-like protein [Drosera capensis]
MKNKARLIVKGFGQKQCIDFEEIFSPVVKMTSIRAMLGLVAGLGLELEQLDVKTVFLHGDLEEEIYMVQPEGFEVKGKEHKVCKLKKSLYGLKQAPRQWYKKFDSFMTSHGYQSFKADPCVYFKRFSNGKFLILLLYVDDMLVTGQDAQMIAMLKELSKAFDMKDMGQARQYWACRLLVTGRPRDFGCHRKKKEKDEMSSVPYSSAVGSLIKQHWEAVKWILRYLKGTSKLCLSFEKGEPVLEGYTDANMAGELDHRKSTSGYVFTFVGGVVSWQSKLQKCVALLTTEGEYIAATKAGKELLWLTRFFLEVGMQQEEKVVFCDSQSAIELSKNDLYHSRTKHIDVRFHWLRDAIEKKKMKLKKIHTNKNPSDMLTKTVTKDKLELYCRLVGMDTR